MKKFIVVLAAAAVLGGCGLNSTSAQFEVSNDCVGSYVVLKANGVVRDDSLAFGGSFTLDKSMGNGQILLTAIGYRLTDNYPLGTATYGPISIYNSGNTITGPQQFGWQITSLITSDPNGGCQNH